MTEQPIEQEALEILQGEQQAQQNQQEEDRERILLNVIDQEEQEAYGHGEDELSVQRAQALSRYHGRPDGNEVDGQSQVISMDVRDTIEWQKPGLMRIFTRSDKVVKFNARNQNDEAGAEQETDFINHVVTQMNPWFNICYTWFTDALLTRNAYCLAYWDEDKLVEQETYRGLTINQIAMMKQDPTLEILHGREYPSPMQPPPQTVMTPMGPQQVPAPQEMLYDVTVRKIDHRGYVHLEVIPPERTKVSARCRTMSLKDTPYFEYWEMMTISELREMGFNVPDNIDSGGQVNEMDETTLSRDVGDLITNISLGDAANADPAMRRVCVRFIWVKCDYNGDGLAEMNYVIRVGKNILHVEECSRVPVACIVPRPMPHRHIGFSTDDDCKDIQEIKTAVLRGALTNLYLANNGRHAVNDLVNLDDFMTSTPGGLVRVDGETPPANAIFPLTHPSIFPQAMQGLEYMDQVRENRTGTTRSFTTMNQNVMNQTLGGLDRMMSSSNARTELSAEVFASGMEELFSIVHELTLKHQDKPMTVKLRDKWVDVDPREWKNRVDLQIAVGLAVGSREQVIQYIHSFLQLYPMALGVGAATPDNVYNSLAVMTDAAGFPNPEKFWTNPAKVPPKPKEEDPLVTVAKINAESRKEVKAMDNVGKLAQEGKKIDGKVIDRMVDAALPDEVDNKDK